jgi:hypothetical protein
MRSPGDTRLTFVRRVRDFCVLTRCCVVAGACLAVAGTATSGSAWTAEAVTDASAFPAHHNAAVVEPWRKLRRRFHFPRLQPGDPCPITASIGALGSPHDPPTHAFGQAPVYVAGIGDFTLFSYAKTAGWFPFKVIWFAKPNFGGRVLVRGRRIDAGGSVRFSWRGHVRPRLRELRMTFAYRFNDWQDYPGPRNIWVQGPGCYAVQVDTVSSSYVIVFEPRPFQQTPHTS